jgi:hypothetical protein
VTSVPKADQSVYTTNPNVTIKPSAKLTMPKGFIGRGELGRGEPRCDMKEPCAGAGTDTEASQSVCGTAVATDPMV